LALYQLTAQRFGAIFGGKGGFAWKAAFRRFVFFSIERLLPVGNCKGNIKGTNPIK
jgi:hypothetical protein